MEQSRTAGTEAAQDAASSPSEAGETRPAGVTTRGPGGRPPGEDLNPLKLRGIDALLTQPSMAAAAAEIGVDPRTITRWFKQPAFVAEYEAQTTELQRELWQQMLVVRGQVWNRFHELVLSKDERVALRACTWFLARMLSQPPIRRTVGDEDERAIPPRLRELLDGTGAFGADQGGDAV